MVTIEMHQGFSLSATLSRGATWYSEASEIRAALMAGKTVTTPRDDQRVSVEGKPRYTSNKVICPEFEDGGKKTTFYGTIIPK